MRSDHCAVNLMPGRSRVPYPISRYLLAPILKLFIRSVDGLEHIPKNGPCIIACRHTGPLDGLFIAAGIVPRINRKIHFIANMGRWKKTWRVLRFITERWAGSIPYDRDNPSACLDRARQYLADGEIVGIFPSGILQEQRDDKPGKTGAARLALWSGAPIIPVGLHNHFAMSTWEMIRKQLKNPNILRIRVGSPIYFPPTTGQDISYDTLRAMTARIMERLEQLSAIEGMV